MHDGERFSDPGYTSSGSRPAGRESCQHFAFELPHQASHLTRGSKVEAPLGEVDGTIFPGPGIDVSEPDPVQLPEIFGSETMTHRVGLDGSFGCLEQRPGLRRVHLADRPDSEEIPQHPPPRSWLKLGLDARGGLAPALVHAR